MAGWCWIIIKICEYFVCCPVACHHCVWVNSEGLSVLLTFVSQFQILIICYTITMSPATNADCSAQEVCSVADTLSTGFLSLSAVTLVRLHGNYNYSETLHNKDKLDTFWVE